MNSAAELTRQIYWSPTGELHSVLQVTTYGWMFVALCVAAYAIAKRLKIWKQGQPEASFDRPLERCKMLLNDVLLQRRVLRKRRQRNGSRSTYAAWMHGLIFYGFLALVFGTTIVALEEHGILRLYRGPFYGFVTIVCELGGLALGAGLFMGMKRRSKQPDEFKHALDYSVLYALLLLLVIQGFLVEAFRLAVQVDPIDGPLSFVGYALAQVIRPSLEWLASSGASDQSGSLSTLAPNTGLVNNSYAVLWYFHMLTTMAFIALVPYTRAFHIVTSVLNLYTARLEQRVLLPKIDLANETAEYFGPKQIRDFTWKDLLSFDSCTECRRCTDICPANAVGKSLDPRQVILKLRDSMLALTAQTGASQAQGQQDVGLYESGVITHDEVWACTNCGACVSECPVGIDQLRTIMQLRRYQTLSLGEVPQAAAKAIENVLQHGNPWGVSAADRFKWAAGLDLPILTGDSPEVEWLYWVGCAGSYDPNNQGVTKSVIKVLQGAGVDFAVLGKAESCTGEPVKRLGDEYNFSEIARTNVENLKALKFKKLVTHCPHCFNTLKNDYKEYGGDFEVYHHSQLLAELYANGRLKLPGRMPEDKSLVTYHDPCFLGRHNGEYEAPRKLLEGVAGLRLAEMELSKEVSSCCGMGGGNMWFESAGGERQIAHDRMEHVAATGAKTLVTGCSFCLINFKGALGRVPGTESLEVLDIAQVAASAMER